MGQQLFVVKCSDGSTLHHHRVDETYGDTDAKAALAAALASAQDKTASEWGVADAALFRPAVGQRVRSEDVAIVGGVVSIDDLQSFKRHLKKQIDRRSRWIIDRGFVVDSKEFSLSRNAQAKWVGLYSRRAAATYPIRISTKDDKTKISLANSAAVDTYFDALSSMVQGVVSGGADLKEGVENAVDEAAAQVVYDADARKAHDNTSPPF